jgi:hypothetical protein
VIKEVGGRSRTRARAGRGPLWACSSGLRVPIFCRRWMCDGRTIVGVSVAGMGRRVAFAKVPVRATPLKDSPQDQNEYRYMSSMLLVTSHEESGRGASPVIVLRARNGGALGSGAWNDELVR